MSRADRLGLLSFAALLASILVFGASGISVGLPLLVFGLLLADGIFRPQSGVLAPTINHGPRDRPRVSLTFDDGPDAKVTAGILDALKAKGARATFFLIGSKIEAHRGLVERMAAEGHELGNHSFEHSRLSNFRGPSGIEAQIERGEQAIRSVLPASKAPLYRPPIGLKNPPLSRVAARRKLQIVAWSLHSKDTRIHDPAALAGRVLRRVRPGDIILFHDGTDGKSARSTTLLALPAVLDGLEARGLKSVTVSELIASSDSPGSLAP